MVIILFCKWLHRKKKKSSKALVVLGLAFFYKTLVFPVPMSNFLVILNGMKICVTPMRCIEKSKSLMISAWQFKRKSAMCYVATVRELSDGKDKAVPKQAVPKCVLLEEFKDVMPPDS